MRLLDLFCGTGWMQRCEPCTAAFVSHILLLASIEGYEKIGVNCAKKTG
jgi:hypothetical protein